MAIGLSNTQKGVLFAFIGYSSYTFADSSEKWLGRSYDVLPLLFWVYVIILGLSVTLALPFGLKRSLKTSKPVFHIMRSICLLFVSGFAIASLSAGIPLATLYTIVFLSPALTTLVAIPLYKEKVSRRSWQIILLGFAGIVVAFHKNINVFTPEIIYAFGVLGFSVATNLMARPICRHESALVIPFYPALLAVPGLFAYLFYTHGSIPLPEIDDLPIFFLAGCGVFVGMTGVIQGFRIAPHAAVAPMQYTQMVGGIIVGHMIFGDFPTMWMLVGAGMIIASGLLLIMQKK